MEVFTDIVQGTDEWLLVRLGIPTSSKFSDVMAKKGPRGGIPKGRQTYMYKLAGEIITGEPMTNFTNAYMDKGHERESEARDLYAFLKDVEPVEVGFIRNGICGCSPDALVGDDGMFENKNAEPHIQIERLLKGTLPPEHKAQCQGALMVAQRSWIDFMSHSRGMPPLIVRVERDEQFISELKIDVADFCEELDQLVERIRSI